MKSLKVDLLLEISNKDIGYKTHFKTTLDTKFSLLIGDSATGKTTTYNVLSNFVAGKQGYYADYNKNKWSVIGDIRILMTPLDADVYLVDEDVSKMINFYLYNKESPYHTSVAKALQDAECKFIFISRSMEALPTSHTTIFKTEVIDNTLILKAQTVYNDLKETGFLDN